MLQPQCIIGCIDGAMFRQWAAKVFQPASYFGRESQLKAWPSHSLSTYATTSNISKSDKTIYACHSIFLKNNNIARVFLKKQPKLPSISIVSGSACCCFSPQFHTQNFILFRASQKKVTKGRVKKNGLFLGKSPKL